MTKQIINPNQDKGKLFVYTGPMNSGKTESMIADALKLQEHSGCNILAFSNEINVRDGAYIKGNNGVKIPATVVGNNSLEKILTTLDDEEKKKTVDVILIDEGNFYNHNLIKILEELKEKEKIIMLAGLNKTFRGETYGVMGKILLEIADNIIYHHAYCKIINEKGKQCRNPAEYTLRLTKNSKQKIDFLNKNKEIISGYGYAPYFDLTTIVESKENELEVSREEYTAVCKECFKIPFKEETIELYNKIKNNQPIEETEYSGKIINMLLNEGKILETETGYQVIKKTEDLNSGMFTN